ncbi:MAG TPA: ABC transporter ATP-binding protein [Micromonosporaceae bacterium]
MRSVVDGAAVRLDGIGKRMARTGDDVLADVNVTVGPNESVAIVGPSGVGKSTLLNVVAGLISADRGEAYVDGRPVTGPDPRVGYLTQKDTLFPWRTALRNVELPLQVRGVDRRTRRERAEAALHLVGLRDAAHRYPAQLSGGMRRRVALARLLVAEPRVLLLDEPFSALDAQLRVALQADLVDLVERDRRPMLLVTHDLEEAITVADRVLVLRGRPAAITADITISYPRPRDVAAVRFDPQFPILLQRLWKEIGDGGAARR